MVWKYSTNPITMPTQADQIGLLLSIVGGLGMLAKSVSTNERFSPLSVSFANHCALYPVLFGLNYWHYKEYKEKSIPCSNSALVICFYSFTAVAAVVFKIPELDIATSLMNRFVLIGVIPPILRDCLNRKQYKDAQGQDYGFYTNSAIILANGVKDLAVLSGALFATHKLQMCASSALDFSLSMNAQCSINIFVGIGLFVIMDKGLDRISYIEEQQI